MQYEHHRRTIDRIAARVAADPEALALIVIGSVVRGEAHDASDVDAFLVVTDETYRRRVAANATDFDASDLAEPPTEGAGGPVVPISFLQAAAERSPEPTRFAFVDALLAVSRDPYVGQLVAAIPIYPERERTEKIVSFAAQLPVHFSYMELADYSQNPYLLTDTSHEMALFGGRLILAHNRLLYPGRKQFLRQIERAPDKPDAFTELMTQLLRRPSIPTARAFCEAVLGFQDWPQPLEGPMQRFQRDRDFAWLRRPAALAES